MTIDSRTLGNVRGISAQNYSSGSENTVELNNRGELIVSQGLPALAQLVSLGGSYWVRSSAVAPVVAVPTTAALLILQNGDATKSYVVDSVFLVQVVVTAAVQNVGILGNVSFATPTTIAGTLTPHGLRSAVGAYGGSARVSEATTIDASNGVAINWQPLGSTGPGQNTLQVGTIVDVDLRGEIILQPGGQLALTALAGAATAASVSIGVRWHEVVLPL